MVKVDTHKRIDAFIETLAAKGKGKMRDSPSLIARHSLLWKQLRPLCPDLLGQFGTGFDRWREILHPLVGLAGKDNPRRVRPVIYLPLLRG